MRWNFWLAVLAVCGSALVLSESQAMAGRHCRRACGGYYGCNTGCNTGCQTANYGCGCNTTTGDNYQQMQPNYQPANAATPPMPPGTRDNAPPPAPPSTQAPSRSTSSVSPPAGGTITAAPATTASTVNLQSAAGSSRLVSLVASTLPQ